MRTAVRTTLTTLLVLGTAGCGGDDESADKTVTVAGKTVTVTKDAPVATATSTDGSGDSDAKVEPVGPPLPDGVVGVDGRYMLKTVNTDQQVGYLENRNWTSDYYEESANAATKCDEGRCSVSLRLGLDSGGSKAFTLAADPEREGTYVGTADGQIKCIAEDRVMPSRERVAVRTGSAKDISGRQVAGRLTVFITTTTRCEDGDRAKEIDLLRGPRQP